MNGKTEHIVSTDKEKEKKVEISLTELLMQLLKSRKKETRNKILDTIE